MVKGKEFQSVWLLKKKDFSKFLVPVLREVKLDTNDKVSRWVDLRQDMPSKNFRYSGNCKGLRLHKIS